MPPYLFASAWIQASLAVGTRGGMTDELKDGYLILKNSQVGLHGCSGNASMKRWRNTMFPSVPPGFVHAVAEKPCAATRAA